MRKWNFSRISQEFFENLNIARCTTDPGCWVQNLNYLEKLKWKQIPIQHFWPSFTPWWIPFHLVHLPAILLAHHHLNDNHYLPMVQQHILSPTWSQLTSSNIPCRPPSPWWPPSPHWAQPPSKWRPPTHNCPIDIISLVLSWFHHQPESHQPSLNQSSCTEWHREAGTHRPNPRDTWVR